MRLLSRWGCSQGLSRFIPGESSRSFPPGTLGIVWLKGDGAENPGLWTGSFLQRDSKLATPRDSRRKYWLVCYLGNLSCGGAAGGLRGDGLSCQQDSWVQVPIALVSLQRGRKHNPSLCLKGSLVGKCCRMQFCSSAVHSKSNPPIPLQ